MCNGSNPMTAIGILKGLLDQVVKITAKTEHAIDDALAFVAATEQRMAELDSKSARIS
jgi:hypothetical protein